MRIRLFSTGIGAIGLLVVLSSTMWAAAPDAGVVRSYEPAMTIRQGMIVALDEKNPSRVTPLTGNEPSRMYGVAIAPSDAPLAITGDTGQRVYVATSGQYAVLVSTQNGAVHAGDYITISALSGIGMKASGDQATVLGRAAADLTTQQIIDSNVAVKTAHGQTTVSLGSVPVAIAIRTTSDTTQVNGVLPGFLRSISSNVANKTVAPQRVYLAVAMLLISAFIAASILYSAVRSGVASIGRNPLARPAIMGGIMQAVMIGAGIFILGMMGVYLIVKL